MGFRLVPKSVTLNDLERRNGRVVCVISPNSVALGPYYAKVVEYTLSTKGFGVLCSKNIKIGGRSYNRLKSGAFYESQQNCNKLF